VTLEVWLGDVLVGYLEPKGDVIAFTFDDVYLTLPGRPVLSQAFEDRALSADQSFTGRPSTPLPSFFRNALPEGALRRVVEARLGHSRFPELEMLGYLGSDLPGALRVVPDPLAPKPAPMGPPSARSAEAARDPIRFSLSGVQLKASVAVEFGDETKITLPLAGAGGRWIAKFPSASFRDLPENEHAMLRWAHAAGLVVPTHRLIEVAAIENLPVEFPRVGNALLIERYDRTVTGRIHQEDFAQVFEIEPEDKDELRIGPNAGVTYEGIGAVVSALAGQDYREFVRRVVFMILSGNADAHAKNWSLIYPDGVHPRLSPLYDVVCTVAYPSLHRTLPLGFVPPADPMLMAPVSLASVTYADVRQLAELAGEEPGVVEEEARTFAERARSAWREVRGEAPAFVATAVDAHLAAISL